jgi:hypothetical protein
MEVRQQSSQPSVQAGDDVGLDTGGAMEMKKIGQTGDGKDALDTGV